MSIQQGFIFSFKEKFGFIKNSEGESFYFDDRLFQKGENLSNIKIGAGVNFEAVSAKKGMRAKNIIFNSKFQTYKPKNDNVLQKTKKQTYDGYKKGTRFIVGGQNFKMNSRFNANYKKFYTGEHRRIEDAKAEAFEIAKTMGVNFLIFESLETRQCNEGNYFYKMFHFTCMCGFYFEPKLFYSEEEGLRSQRAANAFLNRPF